MTEIKVELIDKYIHTCKTIKDTKKDIIELIMRDVEIFRVRIFIGFIFLIILTNLSFYFIYDNYASLVLSSIEIARSGTNSNIPFTENESGLSVIIEWILNYNDSPLSNPLSDDLFNKVLVVFCLSTSVSSYFYFKEIAVVSKLEKMIPIQEEVEKKSCHESCSCCQFNCGFNIDLIEKKGDLELFLGSIILTWLSYLFMNFLLASTFLNMEPTISKFDDFSLTVNVIICLFSLFLLIILFLDIYGIRNRLSDAFKSNSYSTKEKYSSLLQNLSDIENLAMDIENDIFCDGEALVIMNNLISSKSDFTERNDIIITAFYKMNKEKKYQYCVNLIKRSHLNMIERRLGSY